MTEEQWLVVEPVLREVRRAYNRGRPWHDTRSVLEQALKRLASLLYRQGKLNLDEAFVDASLASAKKGASLSVPRGAAKARSSSLLALATVFLSLYLSKALHLPSAGSWKRFLPEVFSTNSRPASATRLTTPTRSIKYSKNHTMSS